MPIQVKPVSLQGFVLTITPKGPWGVPLIIKGWGENTVISVKPDNKTVEQSQGLGGEIAQFVKAFAPAGTLEITCMQTADENTALSALHAAMIADSTGGLVGTVSVLGKDLLGATTFFMATARLESIPDIEYANKPTERKWVFKGGLSAQIAGGNIAN